MMVLTCVVVLRRGVRESVRDGGGDLKGEALKVAWRGWVSEGCAAVAWAREVDWTLKF